MTSRAADHQPALPMLIAALSLMGPFSIDTYLPSFGEIGHTLQATPVEVQHTLTAFLLPFAFMSLWHGALSDAFGRKRVMLIALSVLSLASVGCALAGTIQWLWFFRVLQGLSAGVFVVARAVVRDVYEGAAAQRVMSHVSVLFAVSAAVAPVIGGYLHEWFGWRSVFIFLAGFSAAIAAWAAIALPETLPASRRRSLHPRHLLRGYARTLTHPGFLAAAFAGALSFAALFVYIAGAPVLLLQHLDVKETEFLWLFGPVTAGMMTGSWISGRVAGRLNAAQTLGWGCALMFLSSIGNVVFHATQAAALPWTVLPLFFYAAGATLCMPTLTLIGLDYFPEQRGLASSCQAFLLTAANALTAGALVPIASRSPLRFACVSGAMMLAGLACIPFVRRGAAIEGWARNGEASASLAP